MKNHRGCVKKSHPPQETNGDLTHLLAHQGTAWIFAGGKEVSLVIGTVIKFCTIISQHRDFSDSWTSEVQTQWNRWKKNDHTKSKMCCKNCPTSNLRVAVKYLVSPRKYSAWCRNFYRRCSKLYAPYVVQQSNPIWLTCNLCLADTRMGSNHTDAKVAAIQKKICTPIGYREES